ncbi:unnamed protein product [Euphydryas editha]|uniref:Uncharacterized protein n=1 Tax=Euphydryas editha TaxID=104508 RepID=A0AAU9U5R7_EUPED|nr:unnamed protein product [Euphydryas editha]
MSTDLFISVPRSCLNEFYSKYLNLVETFYYVTLSENKSGNTNVKPDFVRFNVIFNLNPVDSNFNPRELVDRIQCAVCLGAAHCSGRASRNPDLACPASPSLGGPMRGGLRMRPRHDTRCSPHSLVLPRNTPRSHSRVKPCDVCAH